MKESISLKGEQSLTPSIYNQEDITSTSTSVSEKLKALMSAVMISSSVLVASNALAKPNMTEEQLEKAKVTASQMKPPVDFIAMLDEADKFGVECKGNLTIRANIRACLNGISIAQSKERQAALTSEGERLRAEGERLDAENDALREDIVKIVQDTKQMAATMKQDN